MTQSTINTRVNQLSFGNPEKSLVLDRIALEPRDKNKVRVKIEATNINPSDILSIYGVGQYKHYHLPPRVPGFEAVGYVIESGQPEFTPGQKVVVATSGTWQQYIDVLPENLFPIPGHIENGYACQLYINALTAWVITTEIANLTRDDVVIINAGCSAIGKIFYQLSLSLGYTLLSVTSKPDRYPYDSGHVLDATQDLNRQIKRLHLPRPNIAFDAIGGKAGTELVQTLSPDGRYINYGTLSLTSYERHFFEVIKKQRIHFSTFFLRHWEKAAGKEVRLETFSRMVSHFVTTGIKLDVDRYLPLEEYQTALALTDTKSASLSGKIILTM